MPTLWKASSSAGTLSKLFAGTNTPTPRISPSGLTLAKLLTFRSAPVSPPPASGEPEPQPAQAASPRARSDEHFNRRDMVVFFSSRAGLGVVPAAQEHRKRHAA